MGCLLMIFISYQNMVNVDRIMGNPPGPVAKDIEDLGSDITRMLLRYQASEMNRFIFNTWGVGQIGIGLAFLSAVTFTAHRSKFLLIGGAVAVLLAGIQVMYTMHSMMAIGRAFDFLPINAALKERELYQGYSTLNTVLEVLKILIGFSLAIRLLIDRYGWKKKLLPIAPKRLEKRRRSVSGSTRTSSVAGIAAAGKTTDGGGVAVERDAVDKSDDGHVDG